MDELDAEVKHNREQDETSMYMQCEGCVRVGGVMRGPATRFHDPVLVSSVIPSVEGPKYAGCLVTPQPKFDGTTPSSTV